MDEDENGEEEGKKKKTRQLEEQKEKNISRNKKNRTYEWWDKRCRDCKLNGDMNGCWKMYCNIWK